jgi:hypothetical protein
MAKVTAHPEQLRKQGTREEYIIMLEGIYNRYSKDLVPLATEAEKAARKRNVAQKHIDEKAKRISASP